MVNSVLHAFTRSLHLREISDIFLVGFWGILYFSTKNMSQHDASDFLPLLSAGFDSSMDELIADVEWFTLKFDYRNNDKPWGNSKNAIQRSMRLLSADRSEFDEKQGENNKQS